jgi:hypothetical protein
MNHTELRDLMADKAGEFSMSSRIPPEITRRARRRLAVSAIGTGLAMTLLVAGAGVLLTQPPKKPSSPGLTSVPLTIDLVDYYDDGRHPAEDPGTQPPPSREEVDRHVACMREQGFDLPDPTRTDRGWSVIIDDPEALGFDTREWREAAFVTCRPDPPPGPGDLIFGADILSREGIEVFRSCMEAEGFQLPDPIRGSENEWRFDNSNGSLDFGSDSFHRAVFVTCWPGPGN